MTRILRSICLTSLAAALASGVAQRRLRRRRRSRPPHSHAPQQPSDVSTTITSGGDGAPPRFAVPDFIALSTDAETVAIAKTIGQVLWDDLNFEREFALIPRDTYATIPPATSLDRRAVRPLARAERRRRRHRHGAEDRQRRPRRGAAVQRADASVGVRQGLRRIGGEPAALFAHTIADEMHQQQRALRGVARTKLTFDSDRDGERMTGTVEKRERQGDLHLRLRRRESEARDDAALAEHHADVVARRPIDCVHLVSSRSRRTSSSRTSTRARSRS